MMLDIPYAQFLGASIVPGDDPCLLTLPFADSVVGRPGFLHGGAIGGFLEVAAIVALRHALGNAEAQIKPVNLTMDYMRGGRDKPTFGKGIVTRLGNRVANVDAIAWQDNRDKPIAAARMNWLIVRA